LICTVVVNGLNNFVVGFLTALPAVGSAVDTFSYTVCGTWDDVVYPGLEISVECSESSMSEKHRYVVVQSLDTSAESLCMAEVCVYEKGWCAVTFAVMQHYTEHNAIFVDSDCPELLSICVILISS